MKAILAGGGTGGHLFPAIAIAEEIMQRDPKSEVLFVGTRRGLEAKVLKEEGYRLETIAVSGLIGKSFTRTLFSLLQLPVAGVQSAAILLRFRPDVAIGLGGYASGPIILMAALIGIPTSILEVNTKPGFTSRMLARVVHRVGVAFEGSLQHFPEGKAVVTGSPLRKDFLRPAPAPSGTKEGKFNILAFGGSQGSHSINRAVTESLLHIGGRRERISIVHQTGERDLPRVKKAYDELGVEAEVLPFIKDMASRYRDADLVICRSGAITVAEITATGTPAILIPFPHSAGGHQELNARRLEEVGAARLIPDGELNGERLAREITALMDSPQSLEEMAERSAALARRDAAARFVEMVFSLAGKASTA